MGLLPQLRPSASKAVSHLQSQPPKSSTTTPNNNQELTTEAQQLKAAILNSHAASPQFVRFSFRRLRHQTTPPVEIPASVAHARARSACVSGRKVPFTRQMHAHAQQKLAKRQMDSVDEHVHY